MSAQYNNNMELQLEIDRETEKLTRTYNLLQLIIIYKNIILNYSSSVSNPSNSIRYISRTRKVCLWCWIPIIIIIIQLGVSITL